MGIGKDWPVPTTSWAELNYTNMCVNSCWELYGAVDPAHLPGSGSKYDIMITTGNGAKKETKAFPWVTQWDEDEGQLFFLPRSSPILALYFARCSCCYL